MLNSTIDIKGILYHPQLYRSYADAKTTDFDCALYECKHAVNIPGYIKRIEARASVHCYYRPGNDNYAYIETRAQEWSQAEFIGMIFVTIIGGLFDLAIVISFLAWLGYIFIYGPIIKRRQFSFKEACVTKGCCEGSGGCYSLIMTME